MNKPLPIQSVSTTPTAAPNAARPGARPAAGGSSFAEVLDQARQSPPAGEALRISNHAQKRLEARDIQLNDDRLAQLNWAVDRAQQRGGRQSLVLMDDLAFIVNVKERLIVTAMDSDSQKEGVFTQIDSVVLADRRPRPDGAVENSSDKLQAGPR